MRKRIIVAIPIVVVLLLAILIQGWVLAIFAAAIALLCQYEVVRAMDSNGMPVIKTASFLYAILLAALFLLGVPNGQQIFTPVYLTTTTVFVLLVIFVLVAFIASVLSKKHDATSAVNTIFSYIYPQFFFTLFYLLIIQTAQPAPVSESIAGGLTDGYLNMLVVLLMVFIPAVFSDTFAYFFGRAFGKRKLCPDISPKKTVAGSVAGVVFGVVAGVAIWAVFDNTVYWSGHFYTVAPLVNFAVMGGVLAVISQFGDLAASMLKRKLNIKDFGNLLPGHGGVVDRLDSVMFCIPVVYVFKLCYFI